MLFLDEVGEMSPAVQAKFLRVLQEREFQRLGGSRVIKADVRVIAATNRDLEAAMARGEFREDLYYRLRVFEIRLPPLRERQEDVLPLAEAFLEEIGDGDGAAGRPASRGRPASASLAYPWPGNARELRNALERAVILAGGGLITAEHLPGLLPRPGRSRSGLASLNARAAADAGEPAGGRRRPRGPGAHARREGARASPRQPVPGRAPPRPDAIAALHAAAPLRPPRRGDVVSAVALVTGASSGHRKGHRGAAP